MPAAATCANVGSGIGVVTGADVGDGVALVATVAVAVGGVTEVTLLGEALGEDAAGVHAVRQTSKTRTRALMRTASTWISLSRVRGVSPNAYAHGRS